MIKINNIKISVIIPFYNTENFIGKCLESVINQSFQDIEIICLDDASSDNSLDIVKKYANRDSRIKVIEHKKRKGPGFLRNKGIKKALGKYLFFLDSDDWLDLKFFEKMVDTVENLDLDLVFCKILNYDDNSNKFFKSNYNDMNFLDKYSNKVFNHYDVKDVLTNIAVMPCNKLYKKEILIDKNIYFPEKYQMFEDNPFFYEYMINCDKVSFIPEYLYYKRVRGSSIMTSKSNLTDILGIYSDIIEIFEKNNLLELYKSYLCNNTVEVVKLWFDDIPYENNYKNKYYKQAIKFLRYHESKIFGFEKVLTENNYFFFRTLLNSKNLAEFHVNFIEERYTILNEENIELRNNLSEKNRNYLEILNKYEKLSNDHKKLSDDYEKLSDDYEKLSDDYEKLNEKIRSEYITKIGELEKVVSNNDADLLVKNGRIEELEKVVSNNDADLLVKNGRIEELEKVVSNNNADLLVKNKIIKGLEKEKDEYKQIIENKNQEIVYIKKDLLEAVIKKNHKRGHK